MTILTNEQKSDFIARGFSRRHFGRLGAMLTAGAALPFFNEPALAQLSAVRDMPPDAVRINANENPLGPCAEAAAAIQAVVQKGGRYMYEETFGFTETMAAMEGLKSTYVQPYGGSSAPLHQAVLAFTSPSKSFVTANPGYEAGERAAKFVGAKVVAIPLTTAYAHDVKAMATADPNAGLIYVCNPNNPTGTLTPDADLDWLVDNMPRGAVLLLDEAYVHIAGCRMRSDLVAAGKPVIILRTFSKLYGMAGLRVGVALAQPKLLNRLSQYSQGIMPIT